MARASERPVPTVSWFSHTVFGFGKVVSRSSSDTAVPDDLFTLFSFGGREGRIDVPPVVACCLTWSL